MNTYRGFLLAALLMTLAVSVSAATVYIPSGTVIPVTMDSPIGSASGRVGDTFYVHQVGTAGEGFPDNTKFTGNIDSVTRASGSTAGQIGVSFTSAKLPDGTRIPIVGQLTSLDDSSVTRDSSGRYISKTGASKNNLKFAAIGAGAGLVLGQVIGKKPLIGTIIGGAAGYLYGRKMVKPAVGRNVHVPAGTKVGILLTEDVSTSQGYPTAYNPSTASTGAGASDNGWQVTFNNLQPVMRGGSLMVPFRSVMDSIGMPFEYDSTIRQVSVNNYEVQTVHTVGTRTMNVNGRILTMSAPSRIMYGSIYVPASFIEQLTGKTAYWNQTTGVLRIQ